MEEAFDSKPLCKEKHRGTKIKSYDGKISRGFHDKKYPQEVLIAWVCQ